MPAKPCLSGCPTAALGLDLRELLRAQDPDSLGIRHKVSSLQTRGAIILAGWPLVGNDVINLYIGILGIHSLIPY